MSTIATIMLPVRAYSPASSRKSPWKIGVKAHPNSDVGSDPGVATLSGWGSGVWLGDGEVADPGPSPADEAMRHEQSAAMAVALARTISSRAAG